MFVISKEFISLGEIRKILDEQPRIEIASEVKKDIEAGALFVQEIGLQEHHVYGVNTGFGALCERRVENDEINELQYRHIISHAAGVVEPASERVSRLTLLIKLLTFRAGCTGISLDTVRELTKLWNENLIPVIPSKGTVGASGDLAPLAHFALPMLNEGEVFYEGNIQSAAKVKERLGWGPVTLKAKEGLALTNGIQYINAHAVNNLLQIEDLIDAADVIAALSIQGFSAASTFYHPTYHKTSYHPERHQVANNLIRLLEGSNHDSLPTCKQSKQDPYSFRCIPQVHGAIRQVFRNAYSIIEKDINSVSDNPLFFPEEELALYGGNLHGESTALQLDCLSMATTELANISERRTYQLLSGQRGLPDFLVPDAGLNSGLMIPQYTSAALVNHNKTLCMPASVDTIPTCQLQEDHVSMGGTAALKLNEIVWNTKIVLGIELLTAAQAIEFNEGLELSTFTKEVFDRFRESVTFVEKDRIMKYDIEASVAFLEKELTSWVDFLRADDQPTILSPG